MTASVTATEASLRPPAVGLVPAAERAAWSWPAVPAAVRIGLSRGGSVESVPGELEAIGLTTKDMAASCRFYRTVGVDVAEPPHDADHHEATLPNGLRLMWDTEELIRQIDPGWIEPSGQRITLAFACADPADVDATYARVVEAGFSGAKEPWDAFWGQRYAHVLDPDGNTVALFAPLPET
jgi:uncharacterized glyoxalase superfamily protein PhnB